MTSPQDDLPDQGPTGGERSRAQGRTRHKICWVTAIFVLAPVSARGFDISVGGNGGLAEEFNTNIFLTPNPHKEVWGQGFNANLNATASERHWQSRWDANFVNRWYLGNNDLDYANQLFSTKNSYSISERSILGLNANYNRDNTLSSLADNSVDVGYVFRRVPRTSRGISPNWMYSLTEKTRLSAQYSYQDTTYEKSADVAGRFVDSVSHSGVATVDHQYSERLSLRAIGVASTYEMAFQEGASSSPGLVYQNGIPIIGINRITTGGTGVIDTQSLSLGFTYVPTETIKIDFSGGGQFNQVSNPGATVSFEPMFNGGVPRTFNTSSHSSAFSEILSAEATKRFERGEFGFNYSKSLSPNLLGLLISSERYGFNGRYSWTQQLASNFRLAVTDTAASGSGTGSTTRFSQRSQFEIGSGITWTLTERASLSANYLYRQVEYPSSRREAEDHSIILRLQYNPDQIHF
ncbi:MAG: hypothetical protein FIA97_13295 [Methylococcaceae bacterium]|nr:hypothetical protein [Methylococcaceae bacterium]